MSIEDQIRERRLVASQKQAQKARAQAELDSAEERLARARAELKEEFGVETPADAKAIQAQLNADLETTTAAIEAAFAEAGA